MYTAVVHNTAQNGSFILQTIIMALVSTGAREGERMYVTSLIYESEMFVDICQVCTV